MSYTRNLIGAATLVAATFAFSGSAIAGSHGDVCDTPSKMMGNLGSFKGDVITIAGSMQGKDEENLLATVSCFEKATGAVVKYSLT